MDIMDHLIIPIRPPSPFADYPIQPQMLLQHNEDNDTNGSVTWSLPTRQMSFNYKTNDNENTSHSSSPSSSSSSNKNSAWRRTLSKLFKRTKSNKHKKGLFLFILMIF